MEKQISLELQKDFWAILVSDTVKFMENFICR